MPRGRCRRENGGGRGRRTLPLEKTARQNTNGRAGFGRRHNRANEPLGIAKKNASRNIGAFFWRASGSFADSSLVVEGGGRSRHSFSRAKASGEEEQTRPTRRVLRRCAACRERIPIFLLRRRADGLTEHPALTTAAARNRRRACTASGGVVKANRPLRAICRRIERLNYNRKGGRRGRPLLSEASCLSRTPLSPSAFGGWSSTRRRRLEPSASRVALGGMPLAAFRIVDSFN